MLASKTKDIDGVTYESTPFNPFYGLGLAARLGKILGPAALGLLQSLAGNSVSDIMGMGVGALSGPLQAAFTSLQPDAMQKLCLDLLGNTWQGPIEGRPTQLQINSQQNFDLAFMGNYAAIWPAIWLALEANDFFGFGGIGKRLRAKSTPPPSPAPSTPTSNPN